MKKCCQQPPPPDKYRQDNEDFIIFHAGISRCRTLRVILLEDVKAPAAHVYDIIVPKSLKLTAKMRKEESVLRLKHELDALSPAEKAIFEQDTKTHSAFVENPFFYEEVEALIQDLNFKHYLRICFNSLLLPDGTFISSFAQIDEKTEEVFVAEIQSEADKQAVLKTVAKIETCKRTPTVFNSLYRNVLDMPANSIQFTTGPSLAKGENLYLYRKFRLGPIYEGKKGHVQSDDIFPQLKSQSPVSRPKHEKPHLDQAKYLRSVPSAKSFKLLPPLPNLKRNTERKRAEDKCTMRSMASRKEDESRFRLDPSLVESIKCNRKEILNEKKKKQQPFYPTLVAAKVSEPAQEKRYHRLADRYRDNVCIKEIISKYRYPLEKIDRIVRQFFSLCRSEDTATAVHGKEGTVELISPEILEEECLGTCDTARVPLYTVRSQLSKLRRMHEAIFSRVLLALDINTDSPQKGLSLEQFCKLRYYLLDRAALVSEYIQFSVAFLDPAGKGAIPLEDLHRLLKLAVVRDDSSIRGNMLLKTLVTSYALYGIIDDKGFFGTETFETVYRQGKMNVTDLVRAIVG